MQSTDKMSVDRSLRILTYLTTAIALPLNIAATVLSLAFQRHRWARRHVTAFCFIYVPLVMTVVASTISLLYMRKHGKSPRALHYKVFELVSVLGYISVLIPCWSLEIREFSAGGFGLLVGYLTAPMILNMFIHTYFTLNGFPYKKFFSLFSRTSNSCQQCPNCQAKFIPGTTETTTKQGYSLLRGDEYLDVQADPIQYRDSEDFLGKDAERAEQAEQAEETKQTEESSKGKDKDLMEV